MKNAKIKAKILDNLAMIVYTLPRGYLIKTGLHEVFFSEKRKWSMRSQSRVMRWNTDNWCKA